MAKLVRSYRISEEVDTLIKSEAGRLSDEQGKKVSEADVIEIAVVSWLSGSERNTGSNTPVPDGRRSIAEFAMHEAEAKPIEAVAPPKRAESVAQRKAREAKEHAAKLAEADVTARLTGRDDIEYDLENVPRQSILNINNLSEPKTKVHYEVQPRESKPLPRPHGGTDAKRRRDQS